LNNTEYRTSTSVSSEINRLIREIDKHRATASDFYEELLGHASFFKTSKEGSDGIDEKKRRFKRMGVILEELKEEYWDLSDLLLELNGIEILESELAEEGVRISKELIDYLNQMEPVIRNAHKSLRSSELRNSWSDLYDSFKKGKFFALDEVLQKLFSEINTLSDQFRDLRQKRIM